MIKPFDRSELQTLIASEGGPHLSIFLSPPDKPREARDDAIRLSNLVREAQRILTEHWMRKSEVDDFLGPLVSLQRDTGFISRRDHGLAIYRSGGIFNVYPTGESLPQQCFVAKAFRIRPMLAGMESTIRFFLLTLSKKVVKFFSVTPPSIVEVDLPGLADGFQESLLQLSADRGSQVHSAARGPGGKQAAVFHGQGGVSDTEKSELTEYLRRIESSVSGYINDQTGYLILAGVDFLTALYQQVNSSNKLLSETISGNVDHLSQSELLDRALPIARQESRREQESDAVRLREHRQDTVATDPERVICAAYDGLIDTVFLDKDAMLCGSFYPDTRILRQMHHQPTGQPDDPCRDLIESVAIETIKHRGRVYSVPAAAMPIDAMMAAALRG